MQSAVEVVIGASDAETTAAFLAVFDFEVVERLQLSSGVGSELLGVTAGESALSAIRLASPASTHRSTLLVVELPDDVEPHQPPAEGYEAGPRALDVYTTNLAVTASAAEAVGASVSPTGRIAAGPMVMEQKRFVGPDGFGVVAVQTTHRRSSVLDQNEALLHSEPHSVVWVVADQPREVDAFVRLGLTAGAPIEFNEPTISDELGLADRSTPIAMTMLADAEVGSVRVELMTFVDHIDAATAASPLGVVALRYDVDSLDVVLASMPEGATTGERHVLDGAFGERSEAMLLMTAGGIRLVVCQ